MDKIKIHEFDTTIYPYTLWVVVTDDINVLREHFLDRNKDELKGDIDSKGITCDVVSKVNTRKYGSVIAFRDVECLSADISAHEAYHFTCSLFDYIEEKYPSEEAVVYLLEWVVKCCMSLKKKNVV